MEKKPERSPLALPLDAYGTLSADDLEKAAKAAGLSVEKFQGLIARAQKNKSEQEKLVVEREQQTRQRIRNYDHLQPSVRYLLNQWKTSDEMNAKARQFETEAYDIFDRNEEDASGRALNLFKKSQDIKMRNRFYELCAGRTPEEALEILRGEVTKESDKSNVDELRKAITFAFSDLTSNLRRFPEEYKKAQSDSHSPSDSFGSGEKFSATGTTGYVKNPRPRRYNDELDHY